MIQHHLSLALLIQKSVNKPNRALLNSNSNSIIQFKKFINFNNHSSKEISVAVRLNKSQSNYILSIIPMLSKCLHTLYNVPLLNTLRLYEFFLAILAK